MSFSRNYLLEARFRQRLLGRAQAIQRPGDWKSAKQDDAHHQIKRFKSDIRHDVESTILNTILIKLIVNNIFHDPP